MANVPLKSLKFPGLGDKYLVNGITPDMKAALLQLASKVAYIDENGQDYYDALFDALYPRDVESITAVYDPGQDTEVQIDSTQIQAYITESMAWVASDASYSVCVPVTIGKKYKLELSTTDSADVGTIFCWGFSDTNSPTGQTLSGCVRTTPQNKSSATITAIDNYLIIQFQLAAASSIFSNGYFTLTELAATIYETDSLNSLRQYLTVTANFADDTSEMVTTYTLSGTLTVGTSTITVSYGGKTDTFDVTVTEKLYKYVEYVESDGHAWIISGTIPMDTMGECKFKYNVVPSNADATLCGKYSSTQNQRYYMANCNNQNNFTFAARDNSNTYTISAANTNIHTQIYNNASHQAIHDGVVKATNAKFACTAGSVGVDEIVFFARQRGGGNPGAGRLYYAKFTDNTTGNLIADYRPCYRTSDGAIGFHELISDTFYGQSGGSGTLTKGEDLPD